MIDYLEICKFVKKIKKLQKIYKKITPLEIFFILLSKNLKTFLEKFS